MKNEKYDINKKSESPVLTVLALNIHFSLFIKKRKRNL